MQCLEKMSRKWLVTGVAGFIGSNLLETLLELDQSVVGLDNFLTGRYENLEQVKRSVGSARWGRFRLIEGDIEDLRTCATASKGVDFVLHHAALGSVPGSIENPLRAHASNVNGFLNILLACRDNGIKRLVYASSSAVYGDGAAIPNMEHCTGTPLSPYAASKAVNELYAAAFARCYGLGSIGLRYFNVFGPRQDPNGAYAAVIPKWISALVNNEPVYINGDGETTRDFCYVANVVQANLLAATTQDPEAVDQVYNVAVGVSSTLNELFRQMKGHLVPHFHHLRDVQAVYRDFRPGDIQHSVADITKARALLGYQPSHGLTKGLGEALPWYMRNLERQKAADRSANAVNR